MTRQKNRYVVVKADLDTFMYNLHEYGISPGSREIYLHSQHWCTEYDEEAFIDRHHLFARDKTHFHIKLGEFGLAITPRVFVAHAPSDLEIPLESADHEKLLVLLG